MPKKITIDELAAMTQRGFRDLEKRLASKDTVGKLQNLMLNEFKAMRQETQEGTRAVLAAIETVEYTKLRIRLDVLEQRVEKVEQKSV